MALIASLVIKRSFVKTCENPKVNGLGGGGGQGVAGESDTAQGTNQTNQNSTFLIKKFLHDKNWWLLWEEPVFKQLEPVSRNWLHTSRNQCGL